MFGLSNHTLELIANCLRQFPEIAWGKIYGSRAKGDYQRGSDIDLAFSSSVDYSAELHELLDELPTPYLFDVTHYETLRHAELKAHIERVGVVFYQRRQQGVAMKAGWQRKQLGELLQKMETVNPLQAPDEEFCYIDVSSVSNKTFQIEETQKLLGKDAPSRARRLVNANDVLFATIRPTLQRIAIVPDELNGQVCSTGYFVMKPKKELDHRFLFYNLFTENFMSQMEALQKGASYPAVTDAEVRAQVISFPPLLEQQRIVGILDEAFEGIATAKANAEKNLQNARALFESHLQAVFSERGKGWVEKPVKEIAAPAKGSIRTGPFGSQLLHSEFVDEGIAVLGIDNAVANEFRWGKNRFITHEKYRQLERYRVHPGDVLITIMGTCGRCAIIPEGIPAAINTKHICCITLDQKQCLPGYLHIYFLHAPRSQEFLAKHAKGAIMAGLNMGLIQELPVMLPPIKVQKAIVNLADGLSDETQRLESIYQQKLSALDALKKSLLDQAFRGEL